MSKTILYLTNEYLLTALSFFSCLFLTIIYYKYIKLGCVKFAEFISVRIKSDKHTLRDIKGVIELVLIVCTHVCYTTFLFFFLPRSYSLPSEYEVMPLFQMISGILLGFAELSLSMFICALILYVFNSMQIHMRKQHAVNTQRTVFQGTIRDSLVSSSKGGWLAHHFATKTLLPYYVYWIVPVTQVSCEEIVFRFIFWSHMCCYMNSAVSAILSTSLFVLMQKFFTPNWATAFYPIVGATVMGITHSLVFISSQSVLTIISAHITFFWLSLSIKE